MTNHFKVRGDVTAILIERRDGTRMEALIDTADLPTAQSLPNAWTASLFGHGWYVLGCDGKRKTVYLSRLIAKPPEGMVVDHISHDSLDNRRSNLRSISHAANVRHRRGPQTNNTSGSRGVYWEARRNKWKAVIVVDGRQRWLGYHADASGAAAAVSAFLSKAA